MFNIIKSMSATYIAGEDTAQIEKIFNFAAKTACSNGYDMVALKCDNFGWNNRSVFGATDIDFMSEDPARVIAPETGEYIQKWKLEDGVLSVTQYHHDSPNGEKWVLAFFSSDH